MGALWSDFWSLELAARGFLWAFAIYGAASWLRDCRSAFLNAPHRKSNADEIEP